MGEVPFSDLLLNFSYKYKFLCFPEFPLKQSNIVIFLVLTTAVKTQPAPEYYSFIAYICQEVCKLEKEKVLLPGLKVT